MATKDPENARILRDLLEFAEDLNSYGLMSKSSMAKIRSLCVPPPAYTCEQIAAIRTRVAKMSQSVFAAFLNVSVSTVQKWESPKANKQPTGTALRLLQLVESKGVEALIA